MAEPQLPKLVVPVRFRLPAPEIDKARKILVDFPFYKLCAEGVLFLVELDFAQGSFFSSVKNKKTTEINLPFSGADGRT